MRVIRVETIQGGPEVQAAPRGRVDATRLTGGIGNDLDLGPSTAPSQQPLGLVHRDRHEPGRSRSGHGPSQFLPRDRPRGLGSVLRDRLVTVTYEQTRRMSRVLNDDPSEGDLVTGAADAKKPVASVRLSHPRQGLHIQ